MRYFFFLILIICNFQLTHNSIFKKDSFNNLTSSRFDIAIELIKQYETMHSEKHFPYVGYGHKILPGETYSYSMSEDEATELLIKDLRKKCALFREYGKDSLLLGVLAYNVGERNILGGYGKNKSRLLTLIEAGERDFYHEYITFRKANGVVVKSIERRRVDEFNNLYIK